MNNIRHFKPKTADGSALSRILAILIYLGLAWALRINGVGEGGFNLFMILGVFYWVFIHRKVIHSTYFFRFHYLQGTLLFLFLYFSLLLLSIALGAVDSLFQLAGLAAISIEIIGQIQQGIGLIVYYGYPVIGIALALTALLGKTPRIPVITPNVMAYI